MTGFNCATNLTENLGMSDYKILIVDHDFGFASDTKEFLEKNGFTCYLALSHQKGLELAMKHVPDILLCEVDLPERDGVDLIRAIRSMGMLHSVYILMLSSRGDNFLQIMAYNSGADDFMVKPLSERLLLVKIQSLIKRICGTVNVVSQKNSQGIRIDYERYLIIRGKEEIELPKKEFEILSLLYKNPRRVYSREEIKDEIWKTGDDVKSRTIDVHIKKLREKIGEHLIRTIKGVGYKFEQ